MKLVVLLMLLTMYQVQAKVYAQNVSIHLQNTSIKKILGSLEKQTDLRFLYNYDLKSLTDKTDLNVENTPVLAALDRLFLHTELTYKALDNHLVVVIPREEADRRDITVKGVVTDEKGTPLTGVSVRVKGTNNGTLTGNDGSYSLIVPDNAVLQISYIGYETQEIAVNGQTTLNVHLKVSASKLNEVVVIGYGTQLKKDVTSAISTVSTDDISLRPISNPAEVLEGKAPGVQVFQPSGKPGSDFSVRVRGIASPNGNQPLYVIDGVVAYDTKSLDPNSIASISILKDASAAGIYGTAGATNGVVMITTKSGAKGKPKVTVDAYTGMQQIVKKLDMLNGQQLADLLVEEHRNNNDNAFNVPASLLSVNNNWQDIVYRTAPMTGINTGFSGGGDNGTYYFGLGFLDQDGIVQLSNFRRYSVKMNLEQNMNQWLTVGEHFNYNRTNSRDVPDNSRVNQGGVVLGALSTPPFVKKYNDDNTFGLNPFQAWENPLASIEGPYNKTIANNMLGDVHAEAKLPFNLKLRTQFGVSLENYNYDYFLDPYRTQYGASKQGIGQNNNGEVFRYIWDNTLTYDHAFGKHSLNAVIGSSTSDQKESYGSQYGEGFATADIFTLNAASTNKSVSTVKYEWSLQSYFGRVNYSYDDKYLLTASLRADGSSRFGDSTRWGYFPAFSAGWRVSREPFLQQSDFINDLKIRAGWGATGNLPPSNILYPSVSALSVGANYAFPGDPNSAGVVPSTTKGNTDLKWEETKQLNVGFDLTILDNRLSLSADYYDKKTTDMIFDQQLPMSTGLNDRWVNLDGYDRNRGFEFSITGDVFTGGDFTWTSSFNMSFNKNEITGLDSGTVYYYGGIPERGNTIALKNGLPLGAFWGYVSQGVDAKTGNMQFKDLNGDGVIDPDHDRAFLGGALPKFTLGFSNGLTYGNFSLDLLIDGVYGNKVFDATRIETEGMFDVKNASAAVLRRWEKPGDVTDIPRAIFGDPAPDNSVPNSSISSRFLEDGSFVRLKNATLSYRFKGDWLRHAGIDGLRLYVTVQNLVTLTHYKGYYPEVNYAGTSSTTLGIDYGTYPQSKIYTFGINLSL